MALAAVKPVTLTLEERACMVAVGGMRSCGVCGFGAAKHS